LNALRISIARGTREHLEAVLGLIYEASAWLPMKATDQWAQPWPTKERHDATVLNGLETGNTWIVWHGAIPAATVTTASQANPPVWSGSECNLSEPAVYAHRLITARDYAGWGLGAELIDWAGVRAHREYGAKWITIEVWTSNTALHDYYLKRGFEPCGYCADPDYPSGALFQKPVSNIGAFTIPQFSGSFAEFDFLPKQPNIGMALVDGKLRMISIQADGSVRLLDPYNQAHSLLYVASFRASEQKALIDELETLINSKSVSESQLQHFFERNPEFLCGDLYEAAHPHIVLQRPEAGPLIPDFALKPYNDAALCDLMELKLPSARLVVGPNDRKRLSQVVMDACAQLREYRRYFDLPRNRKAIEETYGLRFFLPKMMVVIGRRSDYLANDLRKAESVVPELAITTYDDLLERARFRMKMTKGKRY
jgi:GNAT superfamily N-acetyltransferase